MGLCERCKKAQATFHLTNIEKAGDKHERHLCDPCAIEEGLLQTSKAAIDVSELLQSFVSSGKAAVSAYGHLICDKCGINYVEFRNQGLLGCPNDYEVFKEPLAKLLERAHNGGRHHVGKVPASLTGGRKTPPQQDIARLKRLLQESVEAEDYERAARLRDQIRGLEKA